MRDPTLTAMIRRHRQERPDTIAFIAPDRTWTYAEIDAESSRAAQGLTQLGIGPGERVACLTKHAAEAAVLVLAANKIGAVGVPVNWRLAPPEIEYVLGNGEVRFLLADAAFLLVLGQIDTAGIKLVVATDNDTQVQTFAAWRMQFDAIDPGFDSHPDDTSLQLYSSGTTGLPKGVELTHANLLILNHRYAQDLGFIGGQSVMLNVLPTFHISGFDTAFMPLIEGGTVVFLPDFDPVRVIDAISQYRITHTFMVPAMILFLLQVEHVGQGNYSSLKILSYGGSPVSEKLLIDAQRTFACSLMQIYGMTEAAGTLTALAPEDHDPNGPRAHLLRSAGKPIASVELRIVEPGGTSDVAPGEVGEIWAHSLHNMKGYWRNPKATAEAFPEGRDAHGGWLRTGDAGSMKDGYLYIHDRIKDMIISGGENIYPAEVENILAHHPAVLECAVIGVPDEKWGESVKACVVLKAGAAVTAQEIIDFMRDRLAHYKCPKSVDLLQTLPRNPSGKLLKRILREPHWKGHVRQVS